MQVTCTACKKNMNIPDEKLPKDQAFSITCPGCKTKFKVDQHLKPKDSEPAPPPAAKEKDQTVDTASMVVSQEDFEDDDDLVIYDENDQLALVLDDKNKETWTKALEEKEFKIQYAKSPEHAIHKMKFTHFHFVALNENFGNVALENNPLYQSVIELPMVTRRNIFLALVGGNFKTLNNMQAFQYSANVVINEKDLDKLGDILKKSISENEIFYKVFKETLHAMGKA
ncbi:MAG: hypothetical protein F3744_11115 [Nitrospinae bacterium]|nr:hypothetical protein [Nitrospinota bacterium]